MLLLHAGAAVARGLPGSATLAPRPPQTALCEAAIRAAQRASTVPADLLRAIGMVESGRRDPVSGVWAPWPWTIDAAGQPAFFDSKAQAIAAVRELQARGVASIDVGCMQINLAQHPAAFATLEQAFDPGANAAYAVRFLVSLFDRAGDWTQAATLYHSATPALGAAYQRRIVAAWPAGRLTLLPTTARSPQTALANAWAATLSDGSGSVLLGPQPRQPIHRPARKRADAEARLADLIR